MTRLRRPRGLAIVFRQRETFALSRFLRGDVAVSSTDRIVAASPLDGLEHDLTLGELTVLAGIPSDRWIELREAVEERGFDPEVLADLAERGLILSDGEDARARELVLREEGLAAAAWPPWAALFHHMTRKEYGGSTLRGLVHLDTGRVSGMPEEDPFRFGAIVAAHGPPPPTFLRREDAEATAELPRGTADHPLFELLAERRTSRLFDRGKSLALADLATLLLQVFGCRGTQVLHPDLTVMRRSSPSGGALHPIEAYPLVSRVEGLDPGIYHYDVGRHALARLRRLEEERVFETVERFAEGQVYFATAPVAIVLTARFNRTFWKYREHERAYHVAIMDAAHLSQTFYLVAAALRLGAFVTCAVNDREVERELGLDSLVEGALALLGCGVPIAGDLLALSPEPCGPSRSG